MNKTLKMAENLEGCGAGIEANEMRRLAAIEQAAINLIKCRGRYHAEQNTKALAAALGIELPQLDDIDVVELSRPSAAELQHAEIGLTEPVQHPLGGE